MPDSFGDAQPIPPARQPRVLLVRSAAIRLAAKAVLNLELSTRQATDLARGRTLTDTVNNLVERFEAGVVRGSPAVASDRDFQRNLAVEEVIIGRDNPSGLEEFIRAALAERDRYLRTKEHSRTLYEDIISESKRFSMTHLQFRNFMMRCETLRGRLLDKLDNSIADRAVSLRAKSELDKVITHHIRRAIALLEATAKERHS